MTEASRRPKKANGLLRGVGRCGNAVARICSGTVGALVTLAIVLGAAYAQPVPDRDPANAPLSGVEIPFRLPLDGLFELAEAEMPLQAGHWNEWQQAYGVKTKYRAWRGPLYFVVQGDVLSVQAHVRYWLKARKKLLGAVKLRASCGVNEPPRQAIIGVDVRLAWGPDWTLRPQFRVMPTRFLDRCEMTIADIDVTPLIGREFNEQLEARMRAALKLLAPRLNSVRQQAQRSWMLLQRPIEVGAGQWLSLNPLAVALSPLAGRGNSVQAHLAVLMAPRVVDEVDTAPRPLPPLLWFYPAAEGMHLQLAVHLSYSGLNAAVNEWLAGKRGDIQGRQIGVEAVDLGGEGQEIRVRARLTGDFAGDLAVTANLVYHPDDRTFGLQDLTYTYLPDDPSLEPLASLFHDYLRQALETAANQQLEREVTRLRAGLQTALAGIVPQGVALDLSSLELSQVRIDMDRQGVGVSGQASGHVSVDFDG